MSHARVGELTAEVKLLKKKLEASERENRELRASSAPVVAVPRAAPGRLAARGDARRRARVATTPQIEDIEAARLCPPRRAAHRAAQASACGARGFHYKRSVGAHGRGVRRALLAERPAARVVVVRQDGALLGHREAAAAGADPLPRRAHPQRLRRARAGRPTRARLLSGARDHTRGCGTWRARAIGSWRVGGALLRAERDGVAGDRLEGVAAGTSFKHAMLYDARAADRRARRRIENDCMVNAVHFAPDGKAILSGDSRGAIKTWELRKGASSAAAAHSRRPRNNAPPSRRPRPLRSRAPSLGAQDVPRRVRRRGEQADLAHRDRRAPVGAEWAPAAARRRRRAAAARRGDVHAADLDQFVRQLGARLLATRHARRAMHSTQLRLARHRRRRAAAVRRRRARARFRRRPAGGVATATPRRRQQRAPMAAAGCRRSIRRMPRPPAAPTARAPTAAAPTVRRRMRTGWRRWRTRRRRRRVRRPTTRWSACTGSAAGCSRATGRSARRSLLAPRRRSRGARRRSSRAAARRRPTTTTRRRRRRRSSGRRSSRAGRRTATCTFTTSAATRRTRASRAQRLEGHSDRVYSTSFHPHEPILASCSADFTLKIWVPQTGAAATIAAGRPVALFARALRAPRQRVRRQRPRPGGRG